MNGAVDAILWFGQFVLNLLFWLFVWWWGLSCLFGVCDAMAREWRRYR